MQQDEVGQAANETNDFFFFFSQYICDLLHLPAGRSITPVVNALGKSNQNTSTVFSWHSPESAAPSRAVSCPKYTWGTYVLTRRPTADWFPPTERFYARGSAVICSLQERWCWRGGVGLGSAGQYLPLHTLHSLSALNRTLFYLSAGIWQAWRRFSTCFFTGRSECSSALIPNPNLYVFLLYCNK